MRRHSAIVLYLFLALWLLGRPLSASASEFRSIELPSRPINIAENHGVLWVCGADELIANSTDGGKTWNVRHSLKNGGILLTIGFANEQFGYTAGVNGALAFTNDGGATWETRSAPADVIYEASFSDEKHGLIQGSRAIYTTSDGAVSWTAVRVDFGSESLKGFSNVSTVLALDTKHMAIVVSEGDAAFYHQKLLITKDGGLNWKVVDIPSTGLTRLTIHGNKYWFAGMEVIEKDKPGGGYSVPLLMYSADGEEWTHLPRWSDKGFSACNAQGCLYWDGAGVELPPENPVRYWRFSAEKVVTAKWAIAGNSICSIAMNLKCASVNTTESMPPYVESSSSIAKPSFPPALNAPRGPGVQCVYCNTEKFIVTRDYQGVAEVELKLYIAESGLVEKAEVVHATRPEIGEQIAATARTWIFVPYEKDGVVLPTAAHVKLRVQAIKSN